MKQIDLSQCALGIELGSTRIKAVLIGPDNLPAASGTHDWENRLENGYWTYSLEDVWTGIQDSYANLAKDVKREVWRGDYHPGRNGRLGHDAWVYAL